MPTARVRAASMAAILLLASTPAASQPRQQGNQNLRKLLIGTWEETLHEGVSRTEFQADGTFVYKLNYRLRGGHPATFMTGHWQIRGNQVRMHNEDWSPTSFRYPSGTTREITVEPWTIRTVTVIDAAHIKLDDRMAVRIRCIECDPGASQLRDNPH